MSHPVVLVAAVARNGVIGRDGALPWRLPADLRRFKALTMGHPMIMGRRTFDAIGRMLPGRRSIVVTRDQGWQAAGAEVAHSVDEAVRLAGIGADTDAVMVIGGGEIYRQTMDLADRLEITHVHADVPGDTRFPDIHPAVWQEAARSDEPGFSFVTYTRRSADLGTLIAHLSPIVNDGEYVFVTVPDSAALDVRPVASVVEREGTTLVMSVDDAARLGLDDRAFRCAWITLQVQSALDSVGLTAAVSAALARDGIACNVIAGFHHDHLFVPIAERDRAVAALDALAHVRP